LNDFIKLQVSLKDLTSTFEKNVDTYSRKIVREGANTAIMGTPVDTGEARSNWRGSPSKNPPRGQIPAYAPGGKLGINETANAGIASSAINATLSSRWVPSSGKPFVLFNNWKLIEDLNSGTVSEQGSHFVERAYLHMVSSVRSLNWVKKP